MAPNVLAFPITPVKRAGRAPKSRAPTAQIVAFPKKRVPPPSVFVSELWEGFNKAETAACYDAVANASRRAELAGLITPVEAVLITFHALQAASRLRQQAMAAAQLVGEEA